VLGANEVEMDIYEGEISGYLPLWTVFQARFQERMITKPTAGSWDLNNLPILLRKLSQSGEIPEYPKNIYDKKHV
jgi:hypothetical protein